MLQIENLKNEQWVERVQPNDYTDGRRGKVVDVNLESNRVQVRWLLNPERHGQSLIKKEKGLKTWVNIKNLILCDNMDSILEAKIEELI